MDKLGDLIYILILGIIAVSGFFNSGKKKKRKQEADRRTPTIPQFPDFKEIFKDFEEKKPTPSPKPVGKIIKQKEQTTTSPFLQTNENKRSPLNTQSNTSLIDKNEETPSFLEEFDFHDSNELKKAIIYSEILNRKYS